MKTKCIMKTIVALFIFSINSSCSNSSNHKEMSIPSEDIVLQETEVQPEMSAVEKDQNNQKESLSEDQYPHETPKVIRNANCKINVKNVEKTMSLIRKVISQYNGYVSDERYLNTNYTKENRCVIRIPQKYFDKALDSISTYALFIDHKNITTVNVTEEYIDLSTRIKTKLEVKNRYETILRTKAKTVEEVLKAEDKIRILQEEIEAAKGRLNYLSNKVSYSTIQLDLYETVIPEKEPKTYETPFVNKAKKGFTFGWNVITNITLLFFYIWPLLLLGFLLFIYFKWVK